MQNRILNKLKIMTTVICLTVFFYGNAQIVGNVTDAEGNPIADVSVIFDNEEISRTDASGTFQLKEKFALPLQVSFSHPDYFFSEE